MPSTAVQLRTGRAKQHLDASRSRVRVAVLVASALVLLLATWAADVLLEGFCSFAVPPHSRARQGRSLLGSASAGAPRKRPFAALVARAATAGELKPLTVAVLKERLKAKGLAVSGKKDDLIERLLAAEDGDEEDAGEDDATSAAPAPAPKAPEAEGKRSAASPAPAPAKNSGTPVISGDTVFFLTRTGKYIDIEEHRDDLRARGKEKGKREALHITKEGGGAISSGDEIALKCHMGVYIDFIGSAVRARYKEIGAWQKIRITNEEGKGPIRTGDVVFLRGHQDNVLDVEKEDVKCRWPDEGPWQRLIIEK